MCSPISLTEAARTYLIDLLSFAEQDAVLLRVTSKGCGGHSYEMSFIDGDFEGETVPLDDRRMLVIDQRSLLWLIGTEIDYADTGLETNLVFHNPMAVGQCGCGGSFILKDR